MAAADVARRDLTQRQCCVVAGNEILRRPLSSTTEAVMLTVARFPGLMRDI
jgi:hypothetical protein